MPCRGDVGEIEEVERIGTEELSLQWRIRDFLSLPAGSSDDFYASPIFKTGDERWWLKLWPNWTSDETTQTHPSRWVRLGLRRRDGGPPETFRVSVGMRSEVRGVVERSREEEGEFSGVDRRNWDDFCPRSELDGRRSGLLRDGVFTIACVIRRVMPAGDRGVLSNQETPANRSESSDMRGGEKALEDFARLLASGEESDVIVKVGDVEFKAHKLILLARCPVFFAMFRHDTEERASNRISICDCDPEVFKQYLRYIYTGSVQSLTGRNVFGLFCIADKYLADDLKQLCLQHIRDTLSVQTFCDAARLCLTHGERDLFRLVTAFATRNISSIIKSTEWQNFIREFPTEANEILIKCFRP